jgi:hypothetical protein
MREMVRRATRPLDASLALASKSLNLLTYIRNRPVLAPASVRVRLTLWTVVLRRRSVLFGGVP